MWPLKSFMGSSRVDRFLFEKDHSCCNRNSELEGSNTGSETWLEAPDMIWMRLKGGQW